MHKFDKAHAHHKQSISLSLTAVCADVINAPSNWAALPGVPLGRIYKASLVKQHQGLHIKAKYHKKMLQEAERHKEDRQMAFKLVCKTWQQAAGNTLHAECFTLLKHDVSVYSCV